MRMSILLFDGFTALDVVGGYEPLSRIPGMQVEFVAREKGLVKADTRMLGLLAYRTFHEAKGTDLLYVPGGPGGYIAQRDPEVLDFIRQAHESSQWTFGVCNGVEILATAGILHNVEVTTNYFARTRVAALGAKVLPKRYHRDGKVITGAGVSASADAGLFLTRLIAGDDIAEAIQVGIEYYPQSPFGAPTVDEASERAKAVVGRFEENIEAHLLATPHMF